MLIMFNLNPNKAINNMDIYQRMNNHIIVNNHKICIPNFKSNTFLNLNKFHNNFLTVPTPINNKNNNNKTNRFFKKSAYPQSNFTNNNNNLDFLNRILKMK